MKKYYKITNKEECHYGMEYKNGLNIDILPFDPTGPCCPGGIYFADKENICKFLNYGCFIREVVIPGDALIYHENNKSKADKVILKERRDLSKVETWQWMIEEGIDIYIRDTVKDNKCLLYAMSNGHTAIVQFLINNGVNFCNYDFLCCIEYGYTEIAKLLLDHGVDKISCKNSALCIASEYGYKEIVKLLLDYGADNPGHALQYAASHDHTEIVSLLLNHGADDNAICNALDIASKYGHKATVNLLL